MSNNQTSFSVKTINPFLQQKQQHFANLINSKTSFESKLKSSSLTTSSNSNNTFTPKPASGFSICKSIYSQPDSY
jgi:hypothetical protein